MSKPDFTGTWKFNPSKSSLQIPAPDSATFVIDHREPLFHLSRTHVVDGTSDTFAIELTVNGEQVVRNHSGMAIQARLYWEGETLVCDSVFVREGESASNIVRYRLADTDKPSWPRSASVANNTATTILGCSTRSEDEIGRQQALRLTATGAMLLCR